jgi:hypothetical protein
MKKSKIFLFGIVTLLVIGCQNAEKTDAETKQDPESARKELFSKIYTPDNLESQSFTINSNRDTSLISENGTIYRIYGNSFKSADGLVIKSPIDIEIKEALSPIDFVMANLTTLTVDNQLLESGGMIYINATANGEQLQLSKNSEIGIMLPHDSVDEDMQIYEGSANEGVVSWDNPEPVMNRELKTIERSYTTITYYHDGDETASEEEHRKVGDWLWENGRKVGDKVTIGQSKIDVIAIAKNSEILKESTNGVFMQDVVVKKGQNGFVDDFNTSYIFSVKKLGWANIDRLYSNPDSKEVDFIVSIDNNREFGFVYISLILPEQNMYLPGYQKKNDTYNFSHNDSEKMILPIGSQATILATAYKGDRPFFSIKKIIIKDELDLSMTLEEISLDNLKKELEQKL